MILATAKGSMHCVVDSSTAAAAAAAAAVMTGTSVQVQRSIAACASLINRSMVYRCTVYAMLVVVSCILS